MTAIPTDFTTPPGPEKKNARGSHPERSGCPTAWRTEDMSTVLQVVPPRQLRAAEAALLRWYPAAPLCLIDRIRLHRPGWPVIQGGKGRAHA